MISNLQKSILKTLAFFAAIEHPLTALEIKNWLIRENVEQKKISLSAIEREILNLDNKVIAQNGLFTLAGHEEYFQKRHFTYINSLKLMKKAKRFGGGLRHLPFVRAAALAGSVAWTNASEESDIDIFVITEPGRIYLARLFVSLYFQIFGGRRHGEKIKDRFCLNHYVATGKFMENDHNVYTALIYCNHTPIFGREEFEKIWNKNLPWMKEYLVDPGFPASHVFRYAEDKGSLIQRIFEIVLWPAAFIFEKLASYYQKKRVSQGPFVSVSQDELSFHPDSKGQRVLLKYRKLLENLTT